MSSVEAEQIGKIYQVIENRKPSVGYHHEISILILRGYTEVVWNQKYFGR